MAESSAIAWGPLAEPVRSDAPDAGDPPWRDNAYLAFWAPPASVYGVVHVTTTPNGDGRRARFSIDVGGSLVEVMEPLEPGSFESDSIDFRLDGRILLETPEIAVDLIMRPRFQPGDYTAGEVLPGLVPELPLQHYQQGVDVSGTVTRGDRTVDFAGQGLRDRTWGFRDEASSWVEHLAVFGCFEGFDLTVMKFAHPEGERRVDGFVLAADGTRPITEIRTTRDPSGLFVRATIALADGEQRVISSGGRIGGFWAPIGADEREGPVYTAFDEVHRLTVDGVPGHGIAEQGYLRRLD